MYLSDANLADDEKIEKAKLLVQALKSATPVSLSWIGRFMKVVKKTKMFKCQKIIIQVIKKAIGKFLTFFLVKILVMNGYVRSYETKSFILKQ